MLDYNFSENEALLLNELEQVANEISVLQYYMVEPRAMVNDIIKFERCVSAEEPCVTTIANQMLTEYVALVKKRQEILSKLMAQGD